MSSDEVERYVSPLYDDVHAADQVMTPVPEVAAIEQGTRYPDGTEEYQRVVFK